MKVGTKFILVSILLMLSYGVGGNAMSFSTCISACGSSCQFSESSSNTHVHSSADSHSIGYNKAQTLSISDMELGFKSVSETCSNHYRLRRIIEINDFLKDVMYKFSLLRENSLVLDQSKSYYSNKGLYCPTICSDYYVFALRRILI